MKDIWNRYKGKFKEISFLKFTKKKIKQIGTKTIYKSFLMYHAYQRSETPGWAKHIVLGTIGYILTPIDLLPDLTPLVGYTDDISVLAYGLVMISCYINKDVQQKALDSTKKIYGDIDEQALLDS
jgi:uncharacterized membrane protein YkvA (DUF1232 family)